MQGGEPRLAWGYGSSVGPTLNPHSLSRELFNGDACHIVRFRRHAGAGVFGEDGIVYSRTSSRSVQPCSRRSPTSASSAPILVRSTTSVPSSAVVTTSA